MSVLKGRTALVTGASSGIGADLARELAQRGCHLVVVARREDRLKQLRDEVGARFGVGVHVLAMSLSEPGAAQALFERVGELGASVDVLVNNAGVGVFGDFEEIPWERQRQLLELDVVAPVHLTRLFLPGMLERRFGYVLQVSSIGAFLPTPGYATYSAAKAFLLSFSEALSHELRATPVRVCALCPGVTQTEFFETAGQPMSLFQRATVMPSADVARAGIDALLAGRRSTIPGRLNALSMAATARLAPRRIAVAAAGLLMRYGARPSSQEDPGGA